MDYKASYKEVKLVEKQTTARARTGRYEGFEDGRGVIHFMES